MVPPSEKTLFHLQDVCFRFPGEGENLLFRHLDLQIREGEAFGILGPSGTGKTTLLKMLGGLFPPQSGEVEFLGSPIYRFSAAHRRVLLQRIGMTFQRSGLFDSLTCAENLLFALKEVSGLVGETAKSKATQVLEEVGLGGTEELFVHEMSGGMQKRLGIARAIVLSPEVILYDEPTAGLDPITARSINELILRVRKKYGMTIVVVTSDPVQAYFLSERVGFLYHGGFIEVSDVESIQRSENPVVKQFIRGLLHGPLTESFKRNDRV